MARGKPEKEARLREGDWSSVPTVQNYFGSWSAAIEAAGLTPRPRGRPRKTGDVVVPPFRHLHGPPTAH
jgi:hypothetical protein